MIFNYILLIYKEKKGVIEKVIFGKKFGFLFFNKVLGVLCKMLFGLLDGCYIW